MKANSQNSQKGVSLADLLIVLTITGILVTLAIPHFSKSFIQFTRQNVAQELKAYLDRARFDSVKRHATLTDQMATVTLNNSTSFTITSDLDSDGVLQSHEIRQISFNGKNNIQIVGSSLVFPISIKFNHRGQVTATNGTGSQITPNFIICDQNCTAQTATTTNANTIVISKVGNISIYNGNYETSSISSPNTSNIKTDNKINKTISVSNSVYQD